MQTQLVQILKEVLHVLAKVDTQEMDVIVVVRIYFHFYFIFFFFDFY